MKAVTRASLLVVNGAGLDFWVEKLKSAASDNMVELDTSAMLEKEGQLLSGDEHEGGVNPHYWLDPVLAQMQVEAIATALVAADPGNKESYLGNAADYVAELKSLDAEIKNETQSFSSREFITFHPAWTYFARRYGLVEAAVIEESPGKDPTIDEQRRIIDLARELNVKVIFAEPQFSTKVADTIADGSGAKVLLLDPIGGPGLAGRDSYIALMRYDVEQMGVAMKQ
jgi:zinc transport system substrate-binding protein